MSNNQENSFIAKITCNDAQITFFDQHPAAEELSGSGNLLTTPHAYSRLQFMARYQNNGAPIPDVVAYFRCYGDYYNIQIRSSLYFGHFFSKNNVRILGAFPPAGGNTTSFNLLNNEHKIITLNNLQDNQATVYLKARNAGVINRQLREDPHVYTYGDAPGESVTFKLDILERNVDYPTSSVPYA
ncbi:hypothetical protein QZR14_24650 [Pseudomonas sp. rhizo66]|nr:hypothetical protein [Pseudomonas sp. rhizo66]